MEQAFDLLRMVSHVIESVEERATKIRAVSTGILHFRARVLAVYGQGMFMGNL